MGTSNNFYKDQHMGKIDSVSENQISQLHATKLALQASFYTHCTAINTYNLYAITESL